LVCGRSSSQIPYSRKGKRSCPIVENLRSLRKFTDGYSSA
jgi:hypothetical protein